MKQKRISAFCMAFIIMASAAADLALPVHAAVTVPTAVISFPKGDEGDPGKATVITGNSIGFKQVQPNGYSLNDKGFSIISNSTGVAVTSGITIANPYTELSVANALTPSLPAIGEDQFTIQGSYYAITAFGEVNEVPNYGGSSVGDIVCTTKNAITELSTITLVCAQAETASSRPVFRVDSSVVPKGRFAALAGATVSIRDRTAKEVKFQIGTGADALDFTMTPQTTYSHETIDMGTINDEGWPKKDSSGQIVTKPADNFIRKGTKFNLVFRVPVSNPIFLTVMTPERAMDLIASEIANSDGETKKNYIELAANNSLKFITTDFKLRSRLNQYNADFKISWAWVPDLPTDADAVKISSTNQDWERATITAREDDILGKLEATISYKSPNGSEVVRAAKVTKDVIIRGIGKPVGATQFAQRQGSIADTGTLTPFPVGDTALPGMKTMDAFQGGITGYNRAPQGPFHYVLKLNMGAKNGTANYATVTATGDGTAIAMQTRLGSEQPVLYTSGQQIANPNAGQTNNSTPTEIELHIYAQPLPQDKLNASVKLDIRFFVPDKTGKPVEAVIKPSINLRLVDSTPSQDSSLKSLVFKDQEGDIMPFPTFAPGKLIYREPSDTVNLPYKSEQFTITPMLNDNRGSDKPISIALFDQTNTQVGATVTTQSGVPCALIPDAKLKAGQVLTARITVPSQDPRLDYWSTYEVDLMRAQPSDDATLATLLMYYPDDAKKTNLVKTFNKDKIEYEINVPFSTKGLRVETTTTHPYAEVTAYTPDLKKIDLVGKNYLDLEEAFAPGGAANGGNSFEFKVTVKSERALKDTDSSGAQAQGTKYYTVKVTRDLPSNVSTLAKMEITNETDQKQTFKPNFSAAVETYSLSIPYSTSKIKFNVTPTNVNVNNIEVYSKSVYTDNLVLSTKDGSLKIGAASKGVPVEPITAPDIAPKGYHSFMVVVTAENGRDQTIYELQVVREAPSDENRLSALIIKDQDTTQIKDFPFHKDEQSYSQQVAYGVEQVSFTPTAIHAGSTIRIEEEGVLGALLPNKIVSGETSKLFKLNDAGVAKTFKIIVTSESGRELTYEVRITRDYPSKDARLKKLAADGTETGAKDGISPLFISSTLHYTAKVKEGAQGVTITPTANDKYATITVDGEVVESGKPSSLIELLEITKKIDIIVTAQDRVTTEKYTITFTNENLIEKTNNADLRKLTVNYGQMTPAFKPSVTNYEVTVAEDLYSVDILPKTADSLATMQVFAESKEIGDYNGNFSQSITDGENTFKITVTSPDTKVKKDYNITVYRNEEDQLKNMAPLTPEDIDFETAGDIITVSINQYPRVSSEVFEKLKEYPEKTIIFQGNDYSLRFEASNLSTIIPQAAIYDFRLSFTSVDEDAIMELIERREANDDILNRVVMLYFDYHGDLPGPAILNLSLGRKYANDTLYWHYYNRDRDRIDYYGALESNSKGTFAVEIDHFSTYLVNTRHRIIGSEDKQGNISEGVDDVGIGGNLTPVSKVNPDTGVRGAS